MIKLTLPAKLVWNSEVEEYAINTLGLTRMTSDTSIFQPYFMYISEKGYFYIKNNAIEFGVSHYTFIEQRDFLEIKKDISIQIGMFIAINPTLEADGTTHIFKVSKTSYNYLYDSDDKPYYRPNLRVTILTKNDVKMLRGMKVIR